MPTNYDPGVDYSALIAQEAAKGVNANRPLLAAYETARNAKIAGEGLGYAQTHVYTQEAGRPRYYYTATDQSGYIDELYDAGLETPTIFEWLVQKNSFFGGDETDYNDLASLAAAENGTGDAENDIPTTMLEAQEEAEADADYTGNGIDNRGFMSRDGLAYKNRPIVWVLNNTFYMGTKTRGVRTNDIEYIRENSSEEMPRWLDEYKSVYISEDENIWRNYVEAPTLAPYSPVTIFLYSHHEFPAKQKGLRHTHFEGYSHVETFQMPDYSLMPPAADHRRTLYWNPAVKADKDGRATIELYDTDGSVGAAKGAGMGAGIYSDHREAFATLEKLDVIEPDTSRQQEYADAYARWKQCLERFL